MKRTTLAYCLEMVLGVALVAVGLLDIRAQFLPTAVSEILAPLGGLAIGLGISNLIRQSMIQSDPVLQQREKVRNDERNTAIRYRAEAWAGNVITILLALGGAVSNYLDAPKWITWTLFGIAGFDMLLAWVFTLWLRRKM